MLRVYARTPGPAGSSQRRFETSRVACPSVVRHIASHYLALPRLASPRLALHTDPVSPVMPLVRIPLLPDHTVGGRFLKSYVGQLPSTSENMLYDPRVRYLENYM